MSKVYVKGKHIHTAKVWLGTIGRSGSNQINYSAGLRVDVDADNSFNEMIAITDDGHQLALEPLGISAFTTGDAKRKMTSEQAADYLWRQFVEPLSRG